VLTPIVEGLGSRLIEQRMLRWLAPAAVFWLVGLVAVSWHNDAVWWRTGLVSLVPQHTRWAHWSVPTLEEVFQRPGGDKVTLFVAGLLFVAVTGLLANGATLLVIRFAEGYWPAWLDPLRERRAGSAERRREQDRERLKALKPNYSCHTAAQRREYIDLDQQLESRLTKDHLMPTELGNVLRAAEQRPQQRYGLDIFVCWSRLWLVLPETSRSEINGAREELDQYALVGLWGALTFIWIGWAWWAAPLGALTMHYAYRAMVRAGETYGELLVAAFDVHRVALYRNLRWPLPANPAAELVEGAAITRYLWRGPKGSEVAFTTDKDEGDSTA
jgi:hypothetical protein